MKAVVSVSSIAIRRSPSPNVCPLPKWLYPRQATERAVHLCRDATYRRARAIRAIAGRDRAKPLHKSLIDLDAIGGGLRPILGSSLAQAGQDASPMDAEFAAVHAHCKGSMLVLQPLEIGAPCAAGGGFLRRRSRSCGHNDGRCNDVGRHVARPCRHRKQRHGRHAEPYELMAIFGWSTMKETARYTRVARQKVLAASAMGLLIADQKPNKTVPLLPAPQESGTKENANPLER